MRNPAPCLLVLLSLAPWPGPAPAAPALEPGVAEVRECAERNLPKRTARQRLVLERVAKGADARRLEAMLLWKRGDDGLSRVRVTVEAPQGRRRLDVDPARVARGCALAAARAGLHRPARRSGGDRRSLLGRDRCGDARRLLTRKELSNER